MMNKTKSPALKLAKYILILPLFFLFVTANSIYAAQNEDKTVAVHDLPEPPPEKKEVELDEVFVVVEEQPEFPGGNSAMMKYISETIRYPVEAQKNGLQGRVICNYVVMKDGSIANVQVVRGVDPLLDAEAIRVIEAMPNWKPGKQRGQAVNVRYTLPVVFRLQGAAPQNKILTDEDRKALAKKERDERANMIDEVVVVAYSDAQSQVKRPVDQDARRRAAGNEIFVVVEEQPEFPGGSEAMMQFLADNIRYPAEAHKKGVQGRVICNFVVMKDGTIDSVNVVRGVDPLLDAEAVRVLQSMPKWKPGKQRGQEVNVRFTLPVVFRLDRTEPTEEQREVFQKEMENFERAEFPGGDKAFMKFLADNVRYPVIAQENGIQGLISAVFNIDSKGKVTFVRFNQGVDPSLDAEVKRVIEQMPDWTPAKKDGDPTGMTMGQHFLFRLQGGGVQSYSGPIPEDAVVITGYGGNRASE